MSAAAARLVAQGVHVSLRSRPVLRGVDVDVAAGEIVGVIGPNGAGKSTLLRALAGLAPLDRGTVTLDGRDIANMPLPARARALAFLPQDRIVHWPLSVRAVVALGRAPYRGLASPRDDAAAVAAAMAAMDVAGLADRPVTELSGGERARVLMARALAQGAPTIIADEPTAGLDPAHALILFEELQRLSHEGKAVMTALHDLSLAARYATRVALFKGGRCIADGPPAQVLSNAHLADAFGIDAIVSQVDGFPVFLPRAALRKLT